MNTCPLKLFCSMSSLSAPKYLLWDPTGAWNMFIKFSRTYPLGGDSPLDCSHTLSVNVLAGVPWLTSESKKKKKRHRVEPEGLCCPLLCQIPWVKSCQEPPREAVLCPGETTPALDPDTSPPSQQWDFWQVRSHSKLQFPSKSRNNPCLTRLSGISKM